MTTSRALAIVASTDAGKSMVLRLQEQSDIRGILKAYIEEHMISEIDYGTIPGTEKPTLLQPGAEKIAEIFGCTPEFTITHRIEDWDKGLFHYEFECKLVMRNSGNVLSEGMGSCNSYEPRYRWRNANRKCPHCGKESIIKGKDDYGGGWLCWAKKGGCGAKFDDKDKTIIEQETGKIANEDPAGQVNTILKIAKKRSLVDAAICFCRRYGFQYHQDLEDMGEDLPTQAPKKEEPAGGQASQSPKGQTGQKQTGNTGGNSQPGQKQNGTSSTPQGTTSATNTTSKQANGDQQTTSTGTTTAENNDQGDAWEEPEPVCNETLAALEKVIALANEWEKAHNTIAPKIIEFGKDDSFRKWCEKQIGRPIAINSRTSQLYQKEAISLIAGIDARIAEKSKKAAEEAAAKEKAAVT
jgi:hypothetical protein